MIPGEVISSAGPIEINAALEPSVIRVTNTGDLPVHLTAHFHLFEANPRLSFDRSQAWGMRLDVPASGSVRFEPGETRSIQVVAIGGDRIIRGFSGFVDGPLDELDADDVLKHLVERGYLHTPR